MGLSPRFLFAREFGPEDQYIPRNIGPGDHLHRNCAPDEMVRIGDNGPVRFVSCLGGIVRLRKTHNDIHVLSYGHALNCIVASTVAAYQTGLETHWRFRYGG